MWQEYRREYRLETNSLCIWSTSSTIQVHILLPILVLILLFILLGRWKLHIYNMLFDLRVWDHCLSLAGTSTSEITVERLSGLLREVYVTELLGEESAQCESFFPHSSFDYETEANRFR